MYRVISEEFSSYMQTSKFKDILQSLKLHILYPYKLDPIKSPAPKSPLLFLPFLNQSLMTKAELMTLDLDVADFCLNLLASLNFFD